jgi:NTE family protein
MRAYAILDGGGVKGAALAGCLRAAEAQGVEFEGYGGTSAGALVAMLASIGYDGREIRDLMLNQLKPSGTLDDGGQRLRLALSCQRELLEVLGSTRRRFGKLLALRRVYLRAKDLMAQLWEQGGIYDSSVLGAKLRELVIAKYPQLRDIQNITFRDLEAAGAKQLKIMAADLSGRAAAIFSLSDSLYGESVIGAVVASASYPFMFRPVEVLDGRYLSDGGLASNLPAVLFAREHRETHYPILAFDLVATTASRSARTLTEIWPHVLGTALEASDHLLAEALPGVRRIPVRVPDTVSTLKFDITDEEVEGLFNLGFQAATEYLSEFRPLSNTRRAGEALKRQLWAIYGAPARFQALLWAVATMVEQRSRAKGVRVQIMVPTGRKTHIVAYNYGHRGTDSDTDLEVSDEAGVSGSCFQGLGVVVADLEQMDLEALKISSGQHSRLPPDRRASLSFPIFAQPSGSVPLAVLCVDTSTPLLETGWVSITDVNADEVEISRDVYNVLLEWAIVIARALAPE